MVIHCVMADEALIRRGRLRSLKHTPTQLAAKLGNRASYYSDLMSEDGKKSFGEKAARTIEEGLGLPRFWLDGREAAVDVSLNDDVRFSMIDPGELSSDPPHEAYADGRGGLTRAQPGSGALDSELDHALRVIRDHLAHAEGDASTAAGDALRLLAITPDSDRAFNSAKAALNLRPYQAVALERVAAMGPGAVFTLPEGAGKAIPWEVFLRVAQANPNPKDVHLLMTYLDNVRKQAAREGLVAPEIAGSW